MSEMYDRLMADMKAAMKEHDMVAVNAIRGVIAKAKDLTVNAGKEMTDEAVLAVISKGAKQREESVAQFTAAGRAELAEAEKKELDLLKKYLPVQLGEDEVAEIVKAVIAETGASSKKDSNNKFMVVTDSHDQSYEFISPFDITHATVSITYMSSLSDMITVPGLDGGQIFDPVTGSPNRWRVKRSALEGLSDSPIDSTTDLDDPSIYIFMEMTSNESIGDHLFEVGNGAFANADLRTDFDANAFAVGIDGNAYVQNDVRLHYEHIASNQSGVVEQGEGQMLSSETTTREYVPVSLQKLIKKLLDDGVISIEDIRTDEFK